MIRIQPVKPILLVLFALVPLMSVRGQEGVPEPEPVPELEPEYVVKPSDRAILIERERSRILPGDPMKVVGREQEGNDMRSRTSALTRNTAGPRGVTDDENYQRALALYGDRVTFSRPPTPVALEVASLDLAPQLSAVRAPILEPSVPGSSGSSNLVLGSAIAAVLLAALVVWWRRGMPVEPSQ